MDDDLLDRVIEALETDGLYVDPGAATHVSAEQQDLIRDHLQTLREAEVPTYVLIVDLPYDVYGGRVENLLNWVWDTTGNPGTYLYTDHFFEATQDRDADYSLGVRSWENPDWITQSDFELTGADTLSPDAGGALVRATEALAARASGDLAGWDEFRSEVSEARTQSIEEQSHASRDDGSWVTSPASISVGIILLAVLVVALLRRRGTHAAPSATTGRNGAFVLPPSALELVRAARDARTVTLARDELLSLGEAIDDADLGSGADAAWQATLDHYDAARRVLRPEEPADDVDLLDGVGGLVLVRRGAAALEAARTGRTFVPGLPCFLNPLHGDETSTDELEVGGEALRVPLCGACRKDLRRQRRPEILDVMDEGRPRHYFETDHEPWASTGVGALEPDLVTRLHRRQRPR